MQRRVFVQTRLTDGAEANGGTARLSLGGGFENWLSCEYQTLYCLDSSDLIYQNEVIQPAREDRPSSQRINQAHQGPCLPPYLPSVGGGGACSYRASGPREPPTTPFCPVH